MYAYIYDDYTNQSKFSKLLHKIEKRLTDLNLNGKIIRLSLSKTLKNAVDDEIRQGTKTIVAVGNDKTISAVLNAIVSNQSDERHSVCLGIIPLEERGSKLAEILGIKNTNEACEILLSRRVEIFSLAQINNNCFLFNASIEAPDTILEINKNFILQNLKTACIEIANNPKKEAGGELEGDFDKKLSLKIKDEDGQSFFSFYELILANQNFPIIIDGAQALKTPVKITPGDKKIKIIVGRERKTN